MTGTHKDSYTNHEKTNVRKSPTGFMYIIISQLQTYGNKRFDDFGGYPQGDEVEVEVRIRE